MARKKSEQNPTAKLEAEVVRLLCQGHDIFSAAEEANCEHGFVYVLSIQPQVIALVEASRCARIEQAARDATKQAAEWAEQDAQEKSAATAIESSIIGLIPQRAQELHRMGGKAGDIRLAVDELDKLAGALLKAQKGRRIASGRPVEKTEVKTDVAEIHAAFDRFNALLNADETQQGPEGCEDDGLPPASDATGDPAKP